MQNTLGGSKTSNISNTKMLKSIDDVELRLQADKSIIYCLPVASVSIDNKKRIDASQFHQLIINYPLPPIVHSAG